MKNLTLEDLKKVRPKMLPVEYAELGGTLNFRRISAASAMSFNERFASKDGLTPTVEMLAAGICACLCNEDGTPMFASEAAAAEFIAGLDNDLAMRLFMDGADFNGMTLEAQKEMVKNSEAPTSEDVVGCTS